MDTALLKYIKTNIFPLYERNNKSHQLWHIKGVIERSLIISKDFNVDLNMVYTIAAFHDIGNYISRKNHEIESAKIFMKDKYIKSFFTYYKRKIIKEAIEDHRASLKTEHRSIYGKIIATADRFNKINDLLKSIHLFTLEKNKGISWDEAVEICYEYLETKYGENGYAKIPLKHKSYDKFFISIRKLLKDKDMLSKKLKNVDSKIKEDTM